MYNTLKTGRLSGTGTYRDTAASLCEFSYVHNMIYNRVPMETGKPGKLKLAWKSHRKSWYMKNWPKVMEFCHQSWNFNPNGNKCVGFHATSKKLSIDVESLYFPQNVTNAKLIRVMVMENEEMAMEKSWKNILSSLWEPCTRCINRYSVLFSFYFEFPLPQRIPQRPYIREMMHSALYL